MGLLGGGERFALYCADVAVRGGHEVTFVSETFDRAKCEALFGFPELFEQVRRVTISSFRPTIPRFLLYQRLPYYQRKIRQSVSGETGFDLVLSTQDIGFVPRMRAPIVQYCHFTELLTHLESDPSSPLWKQYYRPARMYYRKRASLIDALLTNSEFTRGSIMQKWGRDAEVVYPPCPIEMYDSTAAKEDLAVTVGRVVPEKRLERFSEIARRLPDYKFIVIGSVQRPNVEYYERLSKAAPVNLSFMVSPPFAAVRDILARAKAYVHCMENEHLGITVVEAMAARCVPIVHDSGGPREVVTPEVGFRWQNSVQAAEYVRTTMQDDMLRKRLAEAAFDRSRLFSKDVFDLRFAKILGRFK